MNRLGGHFSMMMLVSGQDSVINSIKGNLRDSGDFQYHWFDADGAAPEKASEPSEGFAAMFRLEGADRPGLINKLTHIFAQYGLNVERLETSCEPAPFGGTSLFVMEGEVSHAGPLPKSWDPQVIQDKIDDLASAENVDIELIDIDDELEFDDDEEEAK